jgi:putative transposase
VSTLSRNERKELIDWGERDLTITEQAALLKLNRTGLYYRPAVPTEEELALRAAMDRINTEFPYYGSRKLTAVLRKGGFEVSRKKVQRLMHEMGLLSIYPVKKPNLSGNVVEHKKFPYLLRGVEASYPNHIWGTDITYVRLKACGPVNCRRYPTENGYHVCEAEGGMDVSDGNIRLVLALYFIVEHVG